jgi:hypothetical protein
MAANNPNFSFGIQLNIYLSKIEKKTIKNTTNIKKGDVFTVKSRQSF